MAKRPKKLQGVDSRAVAELQAASLEARAKRGLSPTREMEAWWNKDLNIAFYQHQAIKGCFVRSRLLTRALEHPENMKLQELAVKVAADIDDRILGRPQAVEPHRGGVTIVFGDGIDPSRLPKASPKPELPKEANGQVVASRTAQDAPRAPGTTETDPVD